MPRDPGGSVFAVDIAKLPWGKYGARSGLTHRLEHHCADASAREEARGASSRIRRLSSIMASWVPAFPLSYVGASVGSVRLVAHDRSRMNE